MSHTHLCTSVQNGDSGFSGCPHRHATTSSLSHNPVSLHIGHFGVYALRACLEYLGSVGSGVGKRALLAGDRWCAPFVREPPQVVTGTAWRSCQGV